MLDLRPEDILHKSFINRLLMEIIDRPMLAHNLAFKGGSCASVLGYLDRFSDDLDFDILKNADEMIIRNEFHQVFEHLGFKISGEFEKVLLFQLRYPNDPAKRNTMKISGSNLVVIANQYKVQYFTEVDRLMNSQTIETMFANKLVAVKHRYKLRQTIAGRDIYDIHNFFIHGYSYHAPVIQERTGLEPKEYFGILIGFIKEHVNQTIINEDLDTLLPNNWFQQIRKILLPETLSMLAREQKKETTH
jgi:hypothetical protein